MANCVYIHIPFCEKKCKYCAFTSFATLFNKVKYIEALCKEIKFHYKNEALKTLYFGGGTPSLLDIEDIKQILSLFNFTSDTEVTIEINPHLINEEKLKELKNLGINRISIGVQSFCDELLKSIGRTHTSFDIYNTLDNIKKIGFENFSIDLIYGLADQSIENWIETLDRALLVEAKHISLYGLKIEKGTYFYKFPPENLPSQDTQALMYEIALDKLREYYHYEFSNFAINKSYCSKHNSAYWKRDEYYGFGLSSSGFIENKRYTNTTSMKEYLKNPLFRDYINLSKKDCIEEEIFLGLRLIDGIDFCKINEKYNIDIYNYYRNEFDKFISFGLIEKTKSGAKLTKKGQLLQNEVLCEFLNM